MDARGREESQIRQQSIKRPWDEDTTLPEAGNTWHRAILPPIDAPPHRRPSTSRWLKAGGILHSSYEHSSGESMSKRPRYEGLDYKSLSREKLSLNGELHQPPLPHPIIYDRTARGSFESPSFPQARRTDGWESPSGEVGGLAAAAFKDIDNLCRRCRKIVSQQQDLHLFESCEDCKRDPELSHVTQAHATGLAQLSTTLLSALSAEERGIIRNPEQREISLSDFPPIEQFGLKTTLEWLLDRICHINDLADRLVQYVPSRIPPNIDKNFTGSGRNQDGLTDIMKRRLDADLDDTSSKSRGEAIEPTSEAKPHTRRRSPSTTMTRYQDLPAVRFQHDFHPSYSSSDPPSRRSSIMNPPPPPNRQLPSPPGRSLPSPTSTNFPSPSAGPYGSMPQPMNIPPPSNLHQPSSTTYLPSLSSSHSPDALQAHSAALQHEVSVQKIALSSLQNEHDKLLAAFSRSQTRASTLEKKHAVSDNEIITLSEEKLRLQAQVIELERDVEELGRSRDEFRQAAVAEGAQYVEIVKKASQLEEMAGEERKSWNKLKAEMEKRIEELSTVNKGREQPIPSQLLQHAIDDIDTPASSVEATTDVKIEPLSETGPTSYPAGSQESINDLKEEIRQLRRRCAEFESVLRAIRDDSHSMEGLVAALGQARTSILDQAERTLESVVEERERSDAIVL